MDPRHGADGRAQIADLGTQFFMWEDERICAATGADRLAASQEDLWPPMRVEADCPAPR